jgi:hypothetical protein
LHATAFPNQAGSFMFRIVAQNRLWNRRFQMVDFDTQQVLYEWLRDVFVAKNEPEHNRVGDVKVVKRFYVHNYTSVKFRGSNLQRKIFKKQNFANFANKRLQNRSFCQLKLYSKIFSENWESTSTKV